MKNRSNVTKAMRILRALSGLMVALFLAAVAARSTAREEIKFSVIAIHARLYHQSFGTINPTDLLDGKHHSLWNTPIGEGEARSPSRALWILSDLAGPSFARDCGSRLVVNVTEGIRTLLDQTISLDDWFSEGHRLVLPFLVYGTGCDELEITATLEGLPEAVVEIGRLKEVVPFECGE